jgi:hypothetical protein
METAANRAQQKAKNDQQTTLNTEQANINAMTCTLPEVTHE